MTITREVDGGISVVTLDDGKVNTFDADRFGALDGVLDECADDAAVVLCGRDGVFSAGLDLATLSASVDALLELAVALTRTTMRLWTEPRPVVAAVTGHAIAAGTILALACDHAIAAAGDYRWGLNETAIGLVLPQWVVALRAAMCGPTAWRACFCQAGSSLRTKRGRSASQMRSPRPTLCATAPLPTPGRSQSCHEQPTPQTNGRCAVKPPRRP